MMLRASQCLVGLISSIAITLAWAASDAPASTAIWWILVAACVVGAMDSTVRLTACAFLALLGMYSVTGRLPDFGPSFAEYTAESP